jgi:tRNA nucleotidyltransferase (CCA-adding enzyme)
MVNSLFFHYRKRRQVLMINESILPQHLPQRCLSQEAALAKAIVAFAKGVQSLAQDSAHPNTKPRAYLVGGFVRDAILGRTSKDADMEVYGVSEERLEQLLHKLFGDRVNAVGKAFAVYKIPVAPDTDLDIAIPRRESATGQRHRDFTVTGDPGMTLEEAAKRRDFTINAIFADPLTSEIIDPYHGLNDLQQKILQVVDSEHFAEDPLRVYRALQFAARFNLTLTLQTKSLLIEMVKKGALVHLPPERITMEIQKLLLSPKPSIGFELAKELGIIERDYPELATLEGTPQEPDWHPEGNVWIHTMMVIDEAASIVRDEQYAIPPSYHIYVMLGALCHDLGKPQTTEYLDGRIRSRGHEEAGKNPAGSLLEKWRFGEEINRSVIAIAANHLSPSQMLTSFQKGQLTEKQLINAIRRLIRRIDPCPWQAFIAACAADIRGRGGDRDSHLQQADRVRTAFAALIAKQHLETQARNTLVRGEDVLAFGIPSGPRIGMLIQEIERKRDEGLIETREEALEVLKKLTQE